MKPRSVPTWKKSTIKLPHALTMAIHRSWVFNLSTAQVTDSNTYRTIYLVLDWKLQLVFIYLTMSVSLFLFLICMSILIKKKKRAEEHWKLSNWNPRFSPALHTLTTQLLPPWLTWTCERLQWLDTWRGSLLEAPTMAIKILPPAYAIFRNKEVNKSRISSHLCLACS